MLFALKIEVSVPADVPQETKADLRKRENARAIELIKQGRLKRIFRVVGEVSNISLWEAETLEQLHADVGSLPLYPYMKVHVTPLIEHPVTAAWKETNGALPPF
ncbi:MAG TPA: muconolactone Delta-isomerase family protein [Bordetella sp.]